MGADGWEVAALDGLASLKFVWGSLVGLAFQAVSWEDASLVGPAFQAVSWEVASLDVS